MYIRILIAAMVYLMVQAIMFGAGIILVLATPLNAMAMQLIPWVVGVTALLSLPISWLIAPRLRARYWREKGVRSDFISGLPIGWNTDQSEMSFFPRLKGGS